MTSFVHVEIPTEHPGIVRAGRAADSLKQAAHQVLSPRGAATMLLAAMVSALLVVANQVVDTWADGHLMLAWILMWTLAFSVLALAARPVRKAVESVRGLSRSWVEARRAARQDDELWQVALTDARVMADISRAMSSDAARDIRRYY